MSGWVALSVCGPVLILSSSCAGLVLATRQARKLQKLFLPRERPTTSEKNFEDSRPSYAATVKRVIPLYGLFASRSLQYELPRAAACYLLLTFLAVLWSANMLLALAVEEFSAVAAVTVGLAMTAVSVPCFLGFSSAFVSSFNERPARRPEVHGKALERYLLASFMLCSLFLVLGLVSTASAEDFIVEAGVYMFLLGLALDPCWRFLCIYPLRRFGWIACYENMYAPVQLDAEPRKAFVRHVSDTDFASADLQERLQGSRLFEASLQPVRLSPVKESSLHSSPLSGKSNASPRPDQTLATHNEESLDEDLLDVQGFPVPPQRQLELLAGTPSPQKNLSPLKKPVVREALCSEIPTERLEQEPLVVAKPPGKSVNFAPAAKGAKPVSGLPSIHPKRQAPKPVPTTPKQYGSKVQPVSRATVNEEPLFEHKPPPVDDLPQEPTKEVSGAESQASKPDIQTNQPDSQTEKPKHYPDLLSDEVQQAIPEIQQVT